MYTAAGKKWNKELMHTIMYMFSNLHMDMRTNWFCLNKKKLIITNAVCDETQKNNKRCWVHNVAKVCCRNTHQKWITDIIDQSHWDVEYHVKIVVPRLK